MNLNAVNQFIGRDWVYRTNDCWAVFRDAAWAVFGIRVEEIEIPETSSPARNVKLFEQGIEQHGVPIDEPEPGCAVLFRDHKGRLVHIGLHIIGGNVLHCPGTVEHPGRTSYDNLRVLRQAYKHVEFYRYVPCHAD